MTEIRAIKPRIQFWNEKLEGIDISDSLVKVETSKSINEMAGTFSINLKPNPGQLGRKDNYWYDRFDPMDVIGITFDTMKNKDAGGNDRGAQFLGLVDEVHKNINYSGEALGRVFTIVGRDFGSILIDDNLKYAPEAFIDVNMDGTSTGHVAPNYTGVEKEIVDILMRDRRHPLFTENCFVGFGPAISVKDKSAALFSFIDRPITEAVIFIVENASSIRNLVYRINKGNDKVILNYLLDTTKYVRQRDGYVCIELSSTSSYQGNLLNFIRDMIDSDFNEIFVDTKDGVSYLRVRPKPYDRTGDKVGDNVIGKEDPFSWDNLKTFTTDKKYHEIEVGDIVSLNVKRTKQNSYSLFRVNPSALDDINEAMKYARSRVRVDLTNMLRYGLNVCEANSRITYKGSQNKMIDSVFNECVSRLKNWYIYNPIFEQGAITLKGNEDYHIGDKIYLPWYKRNYIYRNSGDGSADEINCDGMYFYVTGVKHSWAPMSTFLSTLSIERGQNDALIKAYLSERQAILKYIRNNVKELYPKIEDYLKEANSG